MDIGGGVAPCSVVDDEREGPGDGDGAVVEVVLGSGVRCAGWIPNSCSGGRAVVLVRRFSVEELGVDCSGVGDFRARLCIPLVPGCV